MNLKVLSIVFLCLFSVSVICSISMVVVNTAEGWSYNAVTRAVRSSCLTTNGIEPTGDPRPGGGWPQLEP